MEVLPGISEKEFFIRLMVSAGIGFLIGFEREYSARKEGEKSFAGVRTFLFIAVLGFAGGWLNSAVSVWALVLLMSGVISLVIVSYNATSRKGNIGGTTEITSILVFILGILTFYGFVLECLVVTVCTMIVLSSKITLHRVISNVTEAEMYDFIRFVVLALLIFPFLPDKNYGPYEVINPREIGLVVLLISGIGFVGYLLMKFLGSNRGILITGLLGGLVSSTAVTWVFSRKSNDAPALSDQCATAILAASSVMVVRVMILVFLFNQQMFAAIILPLLIAFAGAAGICVFFYLRSDKRAAATTDDLKNQSPLQLKGAIVFGVIYMLILLLVSYANERFGNEGILISGAISGFTDIDAITISASRLAGRSIDLRIAEMTVFLAIVSNSIVKLGICIWAGSPPFRSRMLIGYGTVVVAAAIGFLLVALR